MTRDEEAERQRVKREHEESETLARQMSTYDGRRLMWSIINDRSGAMSGTFSGERTHDTAYLEGRRSVGIELLRDLQRAAPSEIVHMFGEAFARNEDERLAVEATASSEAEADGG